VGKVRFFLALSYITFVIVNIKSMFNSNKNEFYMVTSDQLTELANGIAERVMAGLSVEPKKEVKTILPEKDLLSVKEVSKILGVTSVTLWRWEKAGKLQPVHVSSNVSRYRRSDIEKLLS